MDSFEILPYDEFVVIAEEEWQIYCDKNDAVSKFSTRIVNYKWHCSFQRNQTISLQCQEMIEGLVKEMHIEVIVYYRQQDDSQYCRIKQISERKLLKGNYDQWLYIAQKYTFYQSILLTIRILKDRCEFPIFTIPNSVGIFFSDVKLLVGKQIYHINKQLFSMFSPYFDKMFNDRNYKESNQDEIDFKNVEGMANPKVFEDFLLSLCFPACLPGQIEVLPNSQNVADLLMLAQYFQVDMLKKKCERHLELCREMDILGRVLLANKFGLKELQNKLLNSTTLEESRRINFALLNASGQ